MMANIKVGDPLLRIKCSTSLLAIERWLGRTRVKRRTQPERKAQNNNR